MPVFHHEQRLDCPPEALFEFLIRPANVLKLTPPENRLRFIDAPDVISPGLELEFEVRAFGQPQSIVHEIIDVERPRRILERMVHGPLEEFEHEHVFEADNGFVRLIDRIMFVPPKGLIGLLLTEARLMASFEQSFAHRRRLLEQFVAEGAIR
jgi:ligand-binding SRPBCC domain-containing protein